MCVIAASTMASTSGEFGSLNFPSFNPYLYLARVENRLGKSGRPHLARLTTYLPGHVDNLEGTRMMRAGLAVARYPPSDTSKAAGIDDLVSERQVLRIPMQGHTELK